MAVSKPEIEVLVQELSQDAARNGFIDGCQLRKIVELKSNRRIGLLKNNDSELVKDVSKLAFRQQDDLSPILLLSVLQGVDIPVASAILSWTFPIRWGVIDRHAWKTLFKAKLVNGRPDGRSLGPKQWIEYTRIVRIISIELNWLPQQTDTWLYSRDKMAETFK